MNAAPVQATLVSRGVIVSIDQPAGSALGAVQVFVASRADFDRISLPLVQGTTEKGVLKKGLDLDSVRVEFRHREVTA